MARNYAAEYEARKARAVDAGFRSYGQQRRLRVQAENAGLKRGVDGLVPSTVSGKDMIRARDEFAKALIEKPSKERTDKIIELAKRLGISRRKLLPLLYE